MVDPNGHNETKRATAKSVRVISAGGIGRKLCSRSGCDWTIIGLYPRTSFLWHVIESVRHVTSISPFRSIDTYTVGNSIRDQGVEGFINIRDSGDTAAATGAASGMIHTTVHCMHDIWRYIQYRYVGIPTII